MLIFGVCPYTTMHSQRIFAYTQDRTNFENTIFKNNQTIAGTTHLQACLNNNKKKSYGHARYKTTQMESYTYVAQKKTPREEILRKARMR